MLLHYKFENKHTWMLQPTMHPLSVETNPNVYHVGTPLTTDLMTCGNVGMSPITTLHVETN